MAGETECGGEVLVRRLIVSEGQEHLEGYADLARLEEQLTLLDRDTAGGLVNYLHRARELLERSRGNVNPYEGCEVAVPRGEQLDPEVDVDNFIAFEEAGAAEVGNLCFCLVAGGLGERLGYGDIKISLPVDSITEKTYMQWYAEYILALEALARNRGSLVGGYLPLAIMTSEDTHNKTLALFEAHAFFGLQRAQVSFMQQAKVPALLDNDARMAVDAATGEVVTKPHGHGDVHTLLLQHGLARKWTSEGRRWLLFFQDTNALAWRALLALLGVATCRNFAMTSLTVPRLCGEATGAIVALTGGKGELNTTSSVEYNLLSALVEDTSSGTGGNQSKFPGNTNTLLFSLAPYVEVLEKSKGVVPEFVNPKYSDASRTKFKTPTRLECLMQDFSFLLSAHGYQCGFASLPKYVAFSVVKNSNAEAVAKLNANLPPDCAFSGDVELLDSNFRLLKIAAKLAGKPISSLPPSSLTFHGVTLSVGPRIHLAPSFGVGLVQIADSLAQLEIGALFDAPNEAVIFERNSESSLPILRSLPFVLEALDDPAHLQDASLPLAHKIRGYRLLFV